MFLPLTHMLDSYNLSSKTYVVGTHKKCLGFYWVPQHMFSLRDKQKHMLWVPIRSVLASTEYHNMFSLRDKQSGWKKKKRFIWSVSYKQLCLTKNYWYFFLFCRENVSTHSICFRGHKKNIYLDILTWSYDVEILRLIKFRYLQTFLF